LMAAQPSLQLASQSVPLESALNRRLAQDTYAVFDVPPAANSAMDGYALRLEDLSSTVNTLPVSQRVPAGHCPTPLTAGSCARIFTGAEIPEGADTVIIQEDVTPTDAGITFKSIPSTKFDNIRPQGQDLSKGSLLAKRGEKITPPLLGLLASQGLATIAVQRPLKIALLSTGNEIIEPGTELLPGKLFNSNRYAISALLRAWGEVSLCFRHVIDDRAATEIALAQAARDNDLVISFGGVSVGEEDHLKSAVSALGRIEHWKINLKPGKPLMFGHVNQTPLLGLPGNPVSAYVTFLLFAKPLLRALCGEALTAQPMWQLPLGFSIDKPRQRPEYMRARLTDSGLRAAGNQSSGVLSSLHQCDGLAIIPADRRLNVGDLVEFLPMASLIHDT
jgi:molybdopterin molybdotransferase